MDRDQQLEDAIDRAVRELMSVEPHAGLHRRVLARISESSPRRMIVGRLAAGAALVSVLFIAFFLVGRTPEPVQDRVVLNKMPSTPSSSALPAAAATGDPLPAWDAVQSGAQHRASRKPRRVIAAVDAAQEMPFQSTVEIVSLHPVTAISVLPVKAEEILTREITIRPLTVERIELEPLSPPR